MLEFDEIHMHICIINIYEPEIWYALLFVGL